MTIASCSSSARGRRRCRRAGGDRSRRRACRDGTPRPTNASRAARSVGSMILDGVRVVELTAWVAGPAAAGVLADWGADVVKVEPATGDPQRSIFGAIGAREQTSVPPFELDNRGKRSVVLDLRSEAGQEAMERLLERADVFVTNVRVAALDRLGLGPTAVRQRHPSIVYGIITGYGLDGPDAHRPGYDVGAFWARSTLAASVVPPGVHAAGDPQRARRSRHRDDARRRHLRGPVRPPAHRQRPPRLDEPAAHRALLRRLGPGDPDAVRASCRAPAPATPTRRRSSTATRRRTARASGCSGWRATATGRASSPPSSAPTSPPTSASARARDRAVNAGDLIAELDVAFAARDRWSDWVARFDDHDVWWAPINTPRSALEDPQVIASGAFVEMPDGDGGEPVRSVASPIDIDGAAAAPRPEPGPRRAHRRGPRRARLLPGRHHRRASDRPPRRVAGFVNSLLRRPSPAVLAKSCRDLPRCGIGARDVEIRPCRSGLSGMGGDDGR